MIVVQIILSRLFYYNGIRTTTGSVNYFSVFIGLDNGRRSSFNSHDFVPLDAYHLPQFSCYSFAEPISISFVSFFNRAQVVWYLQLTIVKFRKCKLVSNINVSQFVHCCTRQILRSLYFYPANKKKPSISIFRLNLKFFSVIILIVTSISLSVICFVSDSYCSKLAKK